MIAKITGTADEVLLNGVIIDVQGIGYLVHTTSRTLSSIHTGDVVSFSIHHAIRENSMDLYGFSTQEEKEFFELLLSISGIGPKSALGILNVSTIETLKEGIMADDPSHLTKVSGIGKKSAEKIVVELKDKLGTLPDSGATAGGSGDAIDALVALGYSVQDARGAMQKVDRSLSTEEIVKQALKQLSN